MTPAQLDGHEDFEMLLKRRTAAKQALLHAETDNKLRRAMLRKYQGTNLPLEVGQLCFFWRDAKAADLVKIRWHGPARVVAREDKDGNPDVYWIAWKTQLLRCSPHHVRSDYTSANTQVADAKLAIKDVQSLKSRGVTRYLDLDKANRQNLLDIEDEDVGMHSDPEILEPPLQRRRLGPVDETVLPPLPDVMPEDVSPVPTSPASNMVPEDIEPLEIDDESNDFLPVPAAVPPQAELPQPAEHHQQAVLPQPAELPLQHELPQPGVPAESLDEPNMEPPHPPTPAGPPATQAEFQLDPATAALYEPAEPESFRGMRRRFDNQETAIFGPLRRLRQQQAAPYQERQPPPHFPDDPENVNHAFVVEDIQTDALPSGWRMDESGYLQLDVNRPKDFWELRAGCLIRHHILPRRRLHSAKDERDCPVPLDKLDPVRVTMKKLPDGQIKVLTDNGHHLYSNTKEAWTGVTVYQLNGPTRKEYGMYANLPAKKVARQQKNFAKRKPDISERHLSVHEKDLFMKAKVKELQSFFENGVWTFESTKEADPARTLSSRMLLKWSKNPDGSPRAKARLIVRGYADVDALEGNLNTAAPTTSRLSRSFLLSTASILQWGVWTADVQTAFLQGTPQQRELWVQLPAESLRILGAPPETRMKLIKPVYGQLDAPRKWYLEAVRRLKSLGFRQHCLDPCCFLLYETDHKDCSGDGTPTDHLLGPEKLCCIICLHVDDMLGAGSENSATYCRVRTELREVFNFREWQTDKELTYCGATLQREDSTWMVNHSTYLSKVKPITVAKRGPEAELSPAEVSRLRGLLGSLQWPAVQSQPHLCCSASLIAGQMGDTMMHNITEANKLLQFAKDNKDVSLRYSNICPADKLRMVGMFDASFAIRRDGSSQGGFLLMLVPSSTFEGVESEYHLVDWRSFKLPRVARSSLSAEAQAAGQACDALEFACRFWEHLLHPRAPLQELLAMPSSLSPTMITDAKALFDSFHREGLSGNLVDKRTGLEILVLKERLGALNGTFRWMSSERQYADSLTKTGTRQLLADRLRYGKIKFTYDADYTAAKRKTKEEREKSRTEFTLAKAEQPRALPEEDAAGPEEDPTFPTEGFAFSLNISYVDTLTFAPVEPYSVEERSYFSETLETPKETFKPILKYVDKLLRLVLWIYLLMFPITTSAAQPEPAAEVQPASWMTTAAIWAVLLLVAAWTTYMFGGAVAWAGCRAEFLRRRHVRSDRLQRLLDEANERILELETLRDEMVTGHNQLVAGHNQELNTMRQRLRAAQGRIHNLEHQFNYRTEQYRILQERCDEVTGANEDLRAYLRQGRIVMHRATDELRRNWHTEHANAAIYATPRGVVYHQDEQCYRLLNGSPRIYDPCQDCAVRELTPHIGPLGGTTLQEDIDGWIADVDEVVN